MTRNKEICFIDILGHIPVIILLSCVLIFNTAKSQVIYKCHIRILATSKQINNHGSYYFKIRKAEIHGKFIVFKFKAKRKLIVSTDTVWGLQVKENGLIYRVFDRDLYRITDIDRLLIYNRKDPFSQFPYELLYYFSFGLDSELFLVDRKHIMWAFPFNRFMLKRLDELTMFQNLEDWDEKYRTIRFMVWYKECNP